MKPRFFLIFCLIGFALSAFAQRAGTKRLAEDQVPGSIRSSFHGQFEGVSEVQWEEHSINGKTVKYVAIFDQHGIRKRARYRSDGQGITVSSYFLFNRLEQLPKGIHEYTTSEYPDFRIGSAEKIVSLNDERTIYRIRLRKSADLAIIYLDARGRKLERTSLPPEMTEEDNQNQYPR